MDSFEVQLRDASGAVLDELERRARGVMKRAAEIGVAEAKMRAPVSDQVRTRYRKAELTGDDAKHLRETISYQIRRKKSESITVTMGATKFTADMVEFGTKRYTDKDEARLARNARERAYYWGARHAQTEFGTQRTAPRPFIGPASRYMERIFRIEIEAELARIKGLS